jgi:DNA-binding transcriptional regulator YhcF (GntR family)
MPGRESNSFDPDLYESLTENDRFILHVIIEEGFDHFSFDGLKRRVRVHQETLSRTLVRLEDQGIVEKTSKGYEVTSKPKRSEVYLMNNSLDYIPLIQTLLPPGISFQEVLSSLRGRWFGVLRWIGYSKKEDDEMTLKWITEDGEIQVDATFFSDSTLNIDAKLLKRKNNLSDAVKASHQLMSYIVRLYSRKRAASKS